MHGLEPVPVDTLGELRFGEWEGLTIAELESCDDFRRFNTFRSGVRVPGGELMLETQTRMVQQLICLRGLHPDDTVAVVSHGDPLRAVIAYFLGMSLDSLARLEISPGSLSIVQADGWGSRVMSLNETGEAWA